MNNIFGIEGRKNDAIFLIHPATPLLPVPVFCVLPITTEKFIKMVVNTNVFTDVITGEY